MSYIRTYLFRTSISNTCILCSVMKSTMYGYEDSVPSKIRSDESKEAKGYGTYTMDTNEDITITRLMSWCRHNKIAELSHAMYKGVDVNLRDEYGNTMLMVACQNGNYAITRLLVEYKTDLNAKNSKGNTALHFCFAYSFHDIGNFLISNGADEYALNNDGLTCYEGLSAAHLDNL